MHTVVKGFSSGRLYWISTGWSVFLDFCLFLSVFFFSYSTVAFFSFSCNLVSFTSFVVFDFQVSSKTHLHLIIDLSLIATLLVVISDSIRSQVRPFYMCILILHIYLHVKSPHPLLINAFVIYNKKRTTVATSKQSKQQSIPNQHKHILNCILLHCYFDRVVCVVSYEMSMQTFLLSQLRGRMVLSKG